MLTVAEIVEEAGAPAGSVSILPMSRELGDRLVADDRFKVLTFTGSPAVGWDMKARAGQEARRPRARRQRRGDRRPDRRPRLGRAGGSPSAPSPTPARSASASSGSSSTTTSSTRSSAKFIAAARALRLGDPLDARDRPRPDGRREGGAADAGLGGRGRRDGRPGPPGRDGEGTFFAPTILADTPLEAKVCSRGGVRARSSSSSASPTSPTPSAR